MKQSVVVVIGDRPRRRKGPRKARRPAAKGGVPLVSDPMSVYRASPVVVTTTNHMPPSNPPAPSAPAADAALLTRLLDQMEKSSLSAQDAYNRRLSAIEDSVLRRVIEESSATVSPGRLFGSPMPVDSPQPDLTPKPDLPTQPQETPVLMSVDRPDPTPPTAGMPASVLHDAWDGLRAAGAQLEEDLGGSAGPSRRLFETPKPEVKPETPKPDVKPSGISGRAVRTPVSREMGTQLPSTEFLTMFDYDPFGTADLYSQTPAGRNFNIAGFTGRAKDAATSAMLGPMETSIASYLDESGPSTSRMTREEARQRARDRLGLSEAGAGPSKRSPPTPATPTTVSSKSPPAKKR